ncbi:MAG: hypothetical protein ACQSGP_07210 [Frankia sp.]
MTPDDAPRFAGKAAEACEQGHTQMAIAFALTSIALALPELLAGGTSRPSAKSFRYEGEQVSEEHLPRG